MTAVSTGANGAAPGEVDLAAIFVALPGAAAVFAADAPRFTVLAASDAPLAVAQRPRDAVVGRPLAEAFPNASPDDPDATGAAALRASLEAAVRTGAPQRMARQRYDLQRPDGRWEARYWDAVNVPVLGPDGTVRYVFHQTEDVTARVQSDEAAARAEHHAAAILARIADAYIVLDQDFRFVDVNAAAERSMQKTRAELVGRSHWEVFPASHDIDAERNYRRAAREGVELHFTEHYRYEGYDVHLEMDAYPTDAGGVAVFWRDVTARVKAEAALRASEARFRAVQDASPLGFAIHRPIREGGRADGAVVDFTIPYVNDAGARVAGQPRDRILAGTLRAAWPGTVEAGLFADYVRVLETGAPLHRELLYEHAELVAGLEITGVRIGEGSDAELGLTFTDVTARLRAEAERARLLAALGAERERLRSVILDMPAPLALLEGPEHRYALVNDAFRRVSGGGRDVTGLTPVEAFPEAAGQGLWELLDRVYATGEPWVGPETLVRYDRDGTGAQDTWFDLRYEPVRDAAGRVTGILNFAVDVTDQVRARRAVERLLAESEAANAQLQEQGLELELANQQLQDQAGELEKQAEALQDTAASLARSAQARDRALAALQATERWLRLALDGARMVAWEWDPATEQITTSTSLRDIYGVDAIESAAEGFTRVHPEDRPRHQAAVEAAVREARAYYSEFRFIRPDTGETVWIEERGLPVLDGEGRLQTIVGVIIDVSARKRAELEQAEHDRQLRTLADAIPTLAWTARADGFIDWYNARWYEYTGTTPEAMAGWGWQSVHAPAELPRVLERWRAGIAAGEPVEMTFPLRGADGRFRRFLTRIVPVRDADGRVARWFGTNTDVEAEREAREAAEAAGARLALLADASAALLGKSLDYDATLAEAVRLAVPALADYAAVDIVAEDGSIRRLGAAHRDPAFTQVAHQAGRHHAAAPGPAHPHAATLARGEPRLVAEVTDAWMRSAARSPEHLADMRAVGPRSLMLVPLRARERVAGLLILAATTSGRRYGPADLALAEEFARRVTLAADNARLFAEGEAARARAEAASRAKSEFLAVMSHELRTPLNAIGGYAELIELGIRGPVTEQQREDLARIQRSQRALLGLINEVLNYARLETGAVTYALADVPVAEAVAAAEAPVAPQLRAKGLGYAWAGGDPGLRVRADPDKLQQVLLNLLSNAIKFTNARAGLPGRVEVSGEAAGDRVRIRVRDTGVGIPADKLGAVFEPFVQVDATLTRTQEGTGLGLAISRDLARGMGGDLTAESTAGVGSTFTLTLPRA